MTTAMTAVFGWFSHSGCGSPSRPSWALIGPKLGSKSHFQMVAVAIGMVSTGMKKMVR